MRGEDVKARLHAAARARIASEGLARLRARDVAADADCALGTIYKHFADIDDLVLRVNAGTLTELRAAMIAASEAEADADPQARLAAIALAYLAFAEGRPHLWSALFDHAMQNGAPVPEWYLAEQAALFAIVADALGRIDAALPAARRDMRARTIFSAVHGVVEIGLRYRSVGAPRTALENEVRAVATALADRLARV